MSKKWDLRATMLRAWKIWRKGGVSFGEALHRAWMSAKSTAVNAQRIEAAKRAANLKKRPILLGDKTHGLSAEGNYTPSTQK